MPKRNRIPKFESAEIQGEDSWVQIKFPSNKEARDNGREMDRIMKAIKAVSDDTNKTDAEKVEFEEMSVRQVYELITPYIVDWNWVDDDGNPLPKPQTPGVFDKLTSAEYNWIMNKFKTGIPDEKKPSGN